MRSPLSLFVLVLFSLAAIAVNCDDSTDYNNDYNDEWDNLFFWFNPTQGQRMAQLTSDSFDHDTVHSEEQPFQSYASNDFDLPLSPFAVFPKTGSTVVSSQAEFTNDDDKDDMENPREEPKLIENVTEVKTAPESVVPSDCNGKQSKIDELIFDCEMLRRILKVLSTSDKLKDPNSNEWAKREQESVADPDIKLFENFFANSISDKDPEKLPSYEKFAIEEDYATDLSNELSKKKTLAPSECGTEVVIAESDLSNEFVPLEKSTTFVEVVAQSEAMSESVPRKELNIADEMTPKATAVEENKQHDATDDVKSAKKDSHHRMPQLLNLRNFFKKYLI